MQQSTAPVILLVAIFKSGGAHVLWWKENMTATSVTAVMPNHYPKWQTGCMALKLRILNDIFNQMDLFLQIILQIVLVNELKF